MRPLERVMSVQRRNEMPETGSGHDHEWWRQDRLDTIGWAAAFIWAALVLLAETTGFAADYTWWDGWAVFFTGAGAITLTATLFRLLMPEYRRPWVGSLIFGLILLSVGIGDWAGWG